MERTLDLVAEALERGEKVKISGFGNFAVRFKRPRVGRNPLTGEEITIKAKPASRKVRIRAMKGLNESV